MAVVMSLTELKKHLENTVWFSGVAALSQELDWVTTSLWVPSNTEYFDSTISFEYHFTREV